MLSPPDLLEPTATSAPPLHDRQAQSGEPFRRVRAVGIQESQQFSTGMTKPCFDRRSVTPVPGVADEACSGQARNDLRGPVPRTIVDHNDLKGAHAGFFQRAFHCEHPLNNVRNPFLFVQGRNDD